jgi:hypothetical protein
MLRRRVPLAAQQTEQRQQLALDYIDHAAGVRVDRNLILQTAELQRLHLDRLADGRRDHPVADLRALADSGAALQEDEQGHVSYCRRDPVLG